MQPPGSVFPLKRRPSSCLAAILSSRVETRKNCLISVREIQTYVSLPLPAVSAQAFTCSLRPNGGEFYGLKSTPFHYHGWPTVELLSIHCSSPSPSSSLPQHPCRALQADVKWLCNKGFSNQGFCWKESTAAQEDINTIHFNPSLSLALTRERRSRGQSCRRRYPVPLFSYLR